MYAKSKGNNQFKVLNGNPFANDLRLPATNKPYEKMNGATEEQLLALDSQLGKQLK
jgi:hypothetical protein